jgi:branched-chain amino acid transport system permease protein
VAVALKRALSSAYAVWDGLAPLASRRGARKSWSLFTLVTTPAVVCGVVMLVTHAGFTSSAQINLIDLWLIYATVALGFYVVFGLAGRFAFSQTFMMSLGAYVAAWVGHGFWVSLLSAIGISAMFASIFGGAIRRATDFSFAIATLALTEIGSIVFQHWTAFTGVNGMRINVPWPTLFGYQFDTDYKMFYILLVALFIVIVLIRAIERSSLFRGVIAGRDNPVVAETLGVPVQKIQLEMFVLGSGIAGAAGALYATWQGFVSPNSFTLDLAVGVMVMLVLGGMRSVWGGIIGAFIYIFLPDVLSGLVQYQGVIYGLLLLLLIIGFPGGIMGFIESRGVWLRHRASRATPPSLSPPPTRAT